MSGLVKTSSDKKIHLVSLGCARNKVDSEVILGKLLQKGWQYTDDATSADAVVVNTCGFIQSAKEESIDTILSFAELKREKPDFKLVVAGCLSQRYKSQLARGLPEVDFFVGTDTFFEMDKFLVENLPKGSVMAKRTNYLYNDQMPRVNSLSQYSAYVKVAEGCQHNCSFCIIPAIRGRLRSRTIDSLTQEVQKLANQGVKEINLIAQDLAAFGRDRKGDELLALLSSLVKIEGIEWIRMLYMYPENISDEIIEFIASHKKILKYLDIPTQHGSDAVLKRMKRNLNGQQTLQVLQKLRTRIPEISLRTTVMVGFPGETEEDFKKLKSFVKSAEFDHLGCFTYSQEEGTVAARLPDQVCEEVKQKRYHEILTIQQEISSKKLLSKLNSQEEVLVTEVDQNTGKWQGRLRFQAPEIDGVFYGTGTVEVGDICDVEITETSSYDLKGKKL